MFRYIIDKFIDGMLFMVELTDKSFITLFLSYLVLYVIWSILAQNIESYLGIEKKVYLYDLILLFILFAVFAFNSYWLHQVKVKEDYKGISYSISKKDI